VLKLLDVGSRYEMTTEGTVITVRGTAFQTVNPTPPCVFEKTVPCMVVYRPSFVDVFDGRVALVATTSQESVIGAGFGSLVNPVTIEPTSDDVRNDPWVREQLRKDAEFAKRVAETRKKLGDTVDDGNVGNEAGPYTLDQPGITHSNYRELRIVNAAQRTNLNPGEIVKLQALAVFIDPQSGKESTRDVTKEATWQVTYAEPAYATFDREGTMFVGKYPDAQFSVVARWNDGTHEHSGTQTFVVGQGVIVDTQVQLLINDKPIVQ
jgi:hypothetical protein